VVVASGWSTITSFPLLMVAATLNETSSFFAKVVIERKAEVYDEVTIGSIIISKGTA
jgi:hypothetical protein